MKKLKVNKKNFNHVESFRVNCTCMHNCVCTSKRTYKNTDAHNNREVYSIFAERGAGMY